MLVWEAAPAAESSEFFQWEAAPAAECRIDFVDCSLFSAEHLFASRGSLPQKPVIAGDLWEVAPAAECSGRGLQCCGRCHQRFAALVQAAPALLGFGVLPGAGLSEGFGFELLEAVDHQQGEQASQFLAGF